METCLILGAGLMQKPAIQAAKSLGFRTVVIDADKNAVCVPLADCFEPIDLKAKEQILAFAQKLNEKGELKAVFTAGTDFSASVSYVCEKLNLNAHSYQAALNASIKNQMRNCFDECKVPSPRFCKFSKNELSGGKNAAEKILQDILKKLSLPLVVKPVDNMGARGCRMIRTQEEFLPAVQVAVNSSRTGTAIVEEYMDGPEFSIDALVYDGTFTVTGFAIRHIKYPPYFIEVGHTMPAILDKKMRDELISTFALGAKALGLSCGAAKADIKYTSKGPMIGEIAGRLSGGYMSGWTYPYASGLNLTKEALKIAAGMTPDILEQKRQPLDFVYTGSDASAIRAPYQLFEVPCKRVCAERAWMSIPGEVENIENIDDCCNQEKVEYLPRATVSIGSQVDFPRNNVEKCGNILSLSCEWEKAASVCEKAVSDVFITLKPNNTRTEKYLKRKEKDYEAGFPPDAFELPESELDEISGMIPENAKVYDFIPETLKKSEYKDMRDWNYNTIEQTCIKFDKLRPVHPELDAKRFWSALLRGGLQALVYVSDSAE